MYRRRFQSLVFWFWFLLLLHQHLCGNVFWVVTPIVQENTAAASCTFMALKNTSGCETRWRWAKRSSWWVDRCLKTGGEGLLSLCYVWTDVCFLASSALPWPNAHTQTLTVIIPLNRNTAVSRKFKCGMGMWLIYRWLHTWPNCQICPQCRAKHDTLASSRTREQLHLVQVAYNHQLQQCLNKIWLVNRLVFLSKAARGFVQRHNRHTKLLRFIHFKPVTAPSHAHLFEL